MAKITALPVANALAGTEHLPIVQGGVTKRVPMAAFRDLITPFLQYWYKGDQGESGPADAFRDNLSIFKAAAITDGKSDFDGSTWYWTPGDFTGQADDINTVEANSTALTIGAWVRQRDGGVQSRRSNIWRVRNVSQRLNDSTPHLFDVNGLSDATKARIENGTSTDDVTGLAIAAWTQATQQGSPLQLPSGQIGVSGEGIKAMTNGKLVGQGRELTRIKKLDPTSSYGLLVSGKAGVELSGFTVDGSRAGRGMYVNSNFCLYATNATDLRLFDIGVTGALGDGMTFEYCKSVRGIFLTCNDNNKDGLYSSGCDDIQLSNVVALRNNLINIAFAATWDWSLTDFLCAAGAQAELGISRDSRYFRLSDGTLGDRYNGMAPISLYVLAEPVGNQTLHLNRQGTGGITYGTVYDASAQRGIFSNIRCRGQAVLELLEASIFDDSCTFEDSVSHAITQYGCSAVRYGAITMRDYAGAGIALLDSAKNGGVANTDCTVTGASWYKNAGDPNGRIADFVSKGGLREVASQFNGADPMFGSLDTTIPAIAAGAYAEVGDVFVPLIRLGDAIERTSFSVDTPGVELIHRVTATNTVKLTAYNYSGAATSATVGTARVWFSRK